MRLCVAAVFARRTALREQIFLMDRLSSTVSVLERIGARERALFKRFWLGKWAYEPDAGLKAALGSDGLRQVQFTWSPVSGLASAPASSEEAAGEAAERRAVALELAGDCLALRIALAEPAGRDLDPGALWQQAKKMRAAARAALLALQDDQAAADLPLLAQADLTQDELDLYLGALEEAAGTLDPAESRARVAILTEGPPPAEEAEADFVAGADPTQDVRFADLLVRAGRPAEAHALLNQRRDKDALARRLILDHALRLTWSDYGVLLDSVADLALEPLVRALRQSAQMAGRGVGRERLNGVRDQILALGLPHAYERALDAGWKAADATPHAALAAWRSGAALAVAGLTPQTAPDDAAVVILSTDATPPDTWLAHARRLASAGVKIAVVGADAEVWGDAPVQHTADAEALADFLSDTGPTLVTRGKQFVSPDHLWAWASIAPPRTAVRAWTDHVTGHVASILAFEFAYQSAVAEAGLVGAGADLDTAALIADPDAYLNRRFPGLPDRRIATVRPEIPAQVADEPLSLIVVHDAPAAPDLDFVGATRFIWLGDLLQDGVPADGVTLAGLLSDLADAPASTPVLFISQDLPYPPNYARNVVRQFQDIGGLDLSLLAVRRTTHLEGCQPVAASTAGISRLACLATACLSLGSLRRVASALPSRLSTVVDMEEPGFLLTPLFDAPYLGRFENEVKRYLAGESLRGVLSIAGGPPLTEEALSAMTEPARRLLAPIIRNRAYYRAMADNLAEDDFSVLEDRNLEGRADLARELLDLGYLTVATRVFGRTIDVTPRDLARSAALRPLLNLASELGLQAQFAERHRFIIGELIRNRPTEIGPFFEVIGTVLPPEELDRALLTAISGAKVGKSDRGLLRILDAINKYASPAAMNWILFELLSRIPRETLSRPPVQDMLRGLGWRAALSPDRLEALGLAPSLTKLIMEVPLIDQVRRAVAERDWPALADAINAWIGRNLPLLDLIKEIRTYSHELSHSDLAAMAGYYRVYDTPDARLMFAAVIGDQPYLAQAVQTREGDASVIARARMGQFDWLEARLDELGGPLGLTTPAFNPDTVQDVFGSVLAARDPKARKAARAPRVTAIMTLFNPDMDLLPFAVDSALGQEGVEVELVVIDDGSEPEISDAIEALLADRPGVIFERSAVNTGPYVGRNRALQLSKGKFVAIQDGDDVSHPGRFRAQIEALKAAGDKAMLTTAGHMRIDVGGRPQFEHDFTLVGDGTMTSMFRREVFKAVGPFASVRSRGDVEMRERIRAALGAGAVIHIDYPLVYCNAAPDTLSNRTARNTPQYLALFRNNFAKQHRHLRQAVAVGERIAPPNAAVPTMLKP